jgi:hypothetical protein
VTAAFEERDPAYEWIILFLVRTVTSCNSSSIEAELSDTRKRMAPFAQLHRKRDQFAAKVGRQDGCWPDGQVQRRVCPDVSDAAALPVARLLARDYPHPGRILQSLRWDAEQVVSVSDVRVGTAHLFVFVALTQFITVSIHWI